jgi:hypothetical protein
MLSKRYKRGIKRAINVLNKINTKTDENVAPNPMRLFFPFFLPSCYQPSITPDVIEVDGVVL